METERKQKRILFAGLTILILAGIFLWLALSFERTAPKVDNSQSAADELAPMEKLESYGVYNRKGSKIIHHNGGTNEDTEIVGVDAETFEPLNCPYARDKNRVYDFGKEIKGADPKSIKTFGSCYGVVLYVLDQAHVYYDGSIIKGADPSTFEVLAYDDYARDRAKVYFKGKMIPEADPTSFKVLGEEAKRVIYAKDKNAVYYLDEKIPDSDGPSFHRGTKSFKGVWISGADGYDKHSMYWAGDRYDDVTKVLLIDRGRIPQGALRVGNFVVYDNEVYCLENIKGGDYGYKMRGIGAAEFSETAKYLGGPYLKDILHVYYGCQVLDGADPETFEIVSLEGHRAKDKDSIFEWNYEVK